MREVTAEKIELSIRREISQEELEAAYVQLEQINANLFPAAEKPAEVKVEIGTNWVETQPHLSSGDTVGVHIGKDRTEVVFLTKKGKPEHCFALNVGFDNSDKLVEELLKSLEPIRKKRITVHFTVTGAPAALLFVAMPRMPRATMLKALKVQFKNQTGLEKEDVLYTSVAGKKPMEGNLPYLAMSVEKGLTDKVAKALRRAKIRATSWDADLLCYARAAGHLWHEAKLPDATKVLIVLDWDHCHVVIVSGDGKVIAPRLAVGVQSFLQRLLSARESYVPKSADEKDWHVLPSDPVEVRQRKMLALQSIHDVYRPLSQQIKTQLFAACNEHGIQLPSHFAVIAPGTNLFRLEESFAEDLTLKPLATGDFPIESLCALGAALWEKGETKLNALPKSRGESLKGFKEMLRGLGSKLPLGIEGLNLPEHGAALLLAPVLILVLMITIPLWQRWRANSLLERRKAELVSLEGEKRRIAQSKAREEMYEKKFQLSKQIEGRRFAMSVGLRELFNLIPPVIRLQALTFRGDTLTVKGISTNPTALQNFLREALELRHLTDPTAVSVKRDKANTEFELTFRFRT